MNNSGIEAFVKEWMLSQEPDYSPDGNGYVMFTRGALSINLPVVFQSLLEDYLDEKQSTLKQLQVIDKEGKVHDVWKYIMSNDGEASVWCNDWQGRHVIGNDCELYIKP